MVLFEDMTDLIDTPMCKTLANAGIKVKVVDKDDPVRSVINATNDEVLVATGTHMLGMKKKVVIFVQEEPSFFDNFFSDYKGLRALRALTSSTSQLIWLQNQR